MFLGYFEHSLDDKNRLVLPLGLRKGLSEETLDKGFVLIAGTRNKYLVLLPMDEWLQYERELEAKYDSSDEAADDYLTDMYSSAVFAPLDKQYRFTVVDASRKLVGIKKEVCLIGRGRKVLIYAKERWEERQGTRKGDSMAPPPPSWGSRAGRPPWGPEPPGGGLSGE
jgi:MraZ protein